MISRRMQPDSPASQRNPIDISFNPVTSYLPIDRSVNFLPALTKCTGYLNSLCVNVLCHFPYRYCFFSLEGRSLSKVSDENRTPSVHRQHGTDSGSYRASFSRSPSVTRSKYFASVDRDRSSFPTATGADDSSHRRPRRMSSHREGSSSQYHQHQPHHNRNLSSASKRNNTANPGYYTRRSGVRRSPPPLSARGNEPIPHRRQMNPYDRFERRRLERCRAVAAAAATPQKSSHPLGHPSRHTASMFSRTHHQHASGRMPRNHRALRRF